MTLEKIKEIIVLLIEQEEDILFLEQVAQYIIDNRPLATLDDLTEEQYAQLLIAREQVRRGEGIPLEVMREKHRKRFPTANI